MGAFASHECHEVSLYVELIGDQAGERRVLGRYTAAGVGFIAGPVLDEIWVRHAPDAGGGGRATLHMF